MLDLELCVRNLARDLNLSSLDIDIVLSRTCHEGFSFLSKTLPKVSYFLLRSIEHGAVRRELLTHFRWKGGFPIIFGAHFRLIFSPDGKLRSDACPSAIYTIRQFCEYFYKTVVDTSVDERHVQEFLDNDRELADAYDAKHVEELRKFFCTHFRSIHDSTVEEVLRSSPPRFGPGTFSGKELYPIWYFRQFSVEGPNKHFKDYWYSLTKKAFGFLDRRCRQVHPDVDYSELLFVPKDSRGPRTIVREPASLLRFQMSYNGFMSKSLERISNHRVNFTSQDTNRMLARLSSISREYSTIDLSSASDRVSYKVISHLFRYSPLLKFISSSTRSCLLPDGRTVQLKKLSGMGSGLTFPTMSLLIYIACVHCLVKLGLPVGKAKRLVYVYGDDIIVPTIYYQLITAALNRVGLLVNKDKSYHRSHFRESCGGDYYNGTDVTPVRLRLASAGLTYRAKFNKLFYARSQADFFYLQLERHCRELVDKGLVSLSRYYYKVIERRLGPLPYSSNKETSMLVRYKTCAFEVTHRCDSTGTYKPVKGFVPVPVKDKRWKKFQNLFFDTNRYIYGAVTRSARRSLYTWYENILDPESIGSGFGVVPRRIRLVCKEKSSLTLI